MFHLIPPILSWFFHLILLWLINLIHIYILFLCGKLNYWYTYNNILLFYHIFVLLNHTKIHTLQFYLFLILIKLNKEAYSWVFETFSFLITNSIFEKNLSCMIIWFGNQIVSSFLCCYKFYVYVFSYIFHCFIVLPKTKLFISLKKHFLKSFLAVFSYSYQYMFLVMLLD